MRVLKFILWTLLFLYLLVLFFPKANIYYMVEDSLSRYRVALDDEQISDHLGVLQIKGAKVSYMRGEAATIGELDVMPFVFYNRASAHDIVVAKTWEKVVPTPIESASVVVTPFWPVSAFISAEGGFGKLSGTYGIFSGKLRLVLTPSADFQKQYPFIYANFKDVDGELVYEQTFE